MAESAIWSSMRPQLIATFGDKVHACRVENVAGTGMSDINICLGGREIWIESKEQHGNSIRFEPTQIPWIESRLNAGGSVFILVLAGNTIRLHGGWQAGQLAVDPSGVKPYVKIKRPFHWAPIFEILIQRKY